MNLQKAVNSMKSGLESNNLERERVVDEHDRGRDHDAEQEMDDKMKKVLKISVFCWLLQVNLTLPRNTMMWTDGERIQNITMLFEIGNR